MFFRKKGSLRKEYDQKLIDQLEELKVSWLNQKALLEKSLDPSPDIICQAKIAEVKYFYLFKEAKSRQVKLKR
ncbi:YaaL family protein [Peribacillus kribbensis]|uniref:YaaL family protein n=1 Tax=Peribacillus kribbensis TaxID=356658 RepID=UPI0003F51C60|nr:YaaL family protein [Peribacillus kribbensis]